MCTDPTRVRVAGRAHHIPRTVPRRSSPRQRCRRTRHRWPPTKPTPVLVEALSGNFIVGQGVLSDIRKPTSCLAEFGQSCHEVVHGMHHVVISRRLRMLIERSDPVTRAQYLRCILTKFLNRRGDGWRADEPNAIGLHVEPLIQFPTFVVVEAGDEGRIRHRHGFVAVLLYRPGNVQEFLVGHLASGMPLHTVFGTCGDACLLASGSSCDKTCTRSGQSACYSAKYGG